MPGRSQPPFRLFRYALLKYDSRAWQANRSRAISCSLWRIAPSYEDARLHSLAYGAPRLISCFSGPNLPLLAAVVDLCGEHERSQLHSMLDNAGRLLFKSLYADYLKHHRYTGKY